MREKSKQFSKKLWNKNNGTIRIKGNFYMEKGKPIGNTKINEPQKVTIYIKKFIHDDWRFLVSRTCRLVHNVATRK